MTPSSIQRVMTELAAAPLSRLLRRAVGERPCHLVGGVLRDRLLQRASRDVDLVVSGHGADVAARLAELIPARRVDLGGGRFAAFRLVSPTVVVDLWDRFPMSVADDLRRRDLTINSLALDLSSGALEDPSGGLRDLERRCLRATTDLSFRDDPLRVLRLARLSAQLTGFSIDPQTLRLARTAGDALHTVASERIRDELSQLLTAATLDTAFPVLVDTGLDVALFAVDRASPGMAWRTAEALHRLEALASEIDGTTRRVGGSEGQVVDLEAARWLVLVGDSESSPETIETALLRARHQGLLTRRRTSQLIRLATAPAIPDDLPGRRRFLHHCGRDWPTVVVVRGAWRRLRRWTTVLAEIDALAAGAAATLFAPVPLLTGTEICDLFSLEPGPRIGRIQRRILELQVTGELSTPAQAAAWLALRDPSDFES